MIQVAQKTAFTFSATIKGTTFTFQIFAESEPLARQELTASLEEIVNELKSYKAGSRAS